MSYDISYWKTKKLVGLVIPLASLFKPEKSGFHPKKARYEDGSYSFEFFGHGYIKGTIHHTTDGEVLRVSSIDVSGEGSGVVFRWVIQPALADSRGKLVASLVWEGGRSIDRLKVIDGVVSLTKIEI